MRSASSANTERPGVDDRVDRVVSDRGQFKVDRPTTFRFHDDRAGTTESSSPPNRLVGSFRGFQSQHDAFFDDDRLPHVGLIRQQRCHFKTVAHVGLLALGKRRPASKPAGAKYGSSSSTCERTTSPALPCPH